jgi:hypothetical protein
MKAPLFATQEKDRSICDNLIKQRIFQHALQRLLNLARPPSGERYYWPINFSSDAAAIADDRNQLVLGQYIAA